MMINVTVAVGFDGNLAKVYTHMNPLAAGAELLWHSDTRAVFRLSGNDRIVLTGTGLTWDKDGNGGVLTGGSVNALVWRSDRVNLVEFATLQTTGDALWAAFQAEADGSNPQALVKILSRHCWTYEGSDLDDIFPEADMGLFGRLELGGNDRVMLYGGDDVFYTGAARDVIDGGIGNDNLSGGAGNDLLLGGTGNDLLMGGEDDDRVQGSTGNDTLSGGAGSDIVSGGFGFDTVRGGIGNDTLTGGTQADVFQFALGSRQDVITDFQLGIDRLQIDWGGAVTIADQGGEALIYFGATSVLLAGVSAYAVSVADFL